MIIPDTYVRTFMGRIQAVQDIFPLVEGAVELRYEAKQLTECTWRPILISGTFLESSRVFRTCDQFNLVFAVQVGIQLIQLRACCCRITEGHPNFVASELQVPGGPQGWSTFIPRVLPTS